MPIFLYFAVPVFLGSILIEYTMMRRRRQKGRRDFAGYELSDSAASLTMGFGNLIVNAAWKSVALAGIFAIYDQFHLYEIDSAVWWYWPALIIADDFIYYWFHRFTHRTRMGWAAHVIHHSSTFYNYSTALRLSWTVHFLQTWSMIPLVVIGFHPLAVVPIHAVSLIYQFWMHTELVGKLPRWYELVMNTPSHHRVYHGANDEYVDRNFGAIFIVWDRLFGTFQPESVPVRYGLRTEFTSRNPIWIAFHEWVSLLKHVFRARRWKNKLLYFIKPPEWDPGDEPELHMQEKRAFGEAR